MPALGNIHGDSSQAIWSVREAPDRVKVIAEPEDSSVSRQHTVLEREVPLDRTASRAEASTLSRSSGCTCRYQQPDRRPHWSSEYPSSLLAPSLTKVTSSVGASASHTIASRLATRSLVFLSASSRASRTRSRSSVRRSTSVSSWPDRSCNFLASLMTRSTTCQESGKTNNTKP